MPNGAHNAIRRLNAPDYSLYFWSQEKWIQKPKCHKCKNICIRTCVLFSDAYLWTGWNPFGPNQTIYKCAMHTTHGRYHLKSFQRANTMGDGRNDNLRWIHGNLFRKVMHINENAVCVRMRMGHEKHRMSIQIVLQIGSSVWWNRLYGFIYLLNGVKINSKYLQRIIHCIQWEGKQRSI